MNKIFYYMPSAVSGQDEPNLAGKKELSCALGIRVLSRKYKDHALVFFSHIINPLLTKLARSRLTEQAWSITHTYRHHSFIALSAIVDQSDVLYKHSHLTFLTFLFI